MAAKRRRELDEPDDNDRLAEARCVVDSLKEILHGGIPEGWTAKKIRVALEAKLGLDLLPWAEVIKQEIVSFYACACAGGHERMDSTCRQGEFEGRNEVPEPRVRGVSSVSTDVPASAAAGNATAESGPLEPESNPPAPPSPRGSLLSSFPPPTAVSTAATVLAWSRCGNGALAVELRQPASGPDLDLDDPRRRSSLTRAPAVVPAAGGRGVYSGVLGRLKSGTAAGEQGEGDERDDLKRTMMHCVTLARALPAGGLACATFSVGVEAVALAVVRRGEKLWGGLVCATPSSALADAAGRVVTAFAGIYAAPSAAPPPHPVVDAPTVDQLKAWDILLVDRGWRPEYPDAKAPLRRFNNYLPPGAVDRKDHYVTRDVALAALEAPAAHGTSGNAAAPNGLGVTRPHVPRSSPPARLAMLVQAVTAFQSERGESPGGHPDPPVSHAPSDGGGDDNTPLPAGATDAIAAAAGGGASLQQLNAWDQLLRSRGFHPRFLESKSKRFSSYNQAGLMDTSHNALCLADALHLCFTRDPTAAAHAERWCVDSRDGSAARNNARGEATPTASPVARNDARRGAGPAVLPQQPSPAAASPFFCDVCSSGARPDELLVCKTCNDACHYDCLAPPLAAMPTEAWTCDACIMAAPSHPPPPQAQQRRPASVPAHPRPSKLPPCVSGLLAGQRLAAGREHGPATRDHPYLQAKLCDECFAFCTSDEIQYDADDGSAVHCSCCCEGGLIVSCDRDGCPHGICDYCIEKVEGYERARLLKVGRTSFMCYRCNPAALGQFQRKNRS